MIAAIALELLLVQEPALVPEAPAAAAPAEPAAPADVAPVVSPAPAPEAPVAAAPGPVAVAAPGPAPGPPMGVEAPPPRPRRFVFAFLPALTFGLAYLPSTNLAFFFGGRLPRSPWALGYQITLSSGLADRYTLGLFFTHRHHLMAMRAFGARERGFLALGGGAAFLVNSPVVEAEVKVGFRFGRRKRGVVGGLFRLGWDVGHHEQAPVPQLGAFVGVAAF